MVHHCILTQLNRSELSHAWHIHTVWTLQCSLRVITIHDHTHKHTGFISRTHDHIDRPWSELPTRRTSLVVSHCPRATAAILNIKLRSHRFALSFSSSSINPSMILLSSLKSLRQRYNIHSVLRTTIKPWNAQFALKVKWALTIKQRKRKTHRSMLDVIFYPYV